MVFSVPAMALAIFINMLWGGNIVAVKLGMVAVPPLLSAFWRFLLGGLALAVWAVVMRVDLRPARADWPGLLVLSLLFTVQIGLMNVGTHLTTAAMATVLISTNPFFATLFSHFFVPGDRMRARRIVGLLVAFSGVALIVLPRAGEAAVAGASLLGNLTVLSSAALLGGRQVAITRMVRRMGTAQVIFWQGLISLPLFLGAGLWLEDVDWSALSWQPMAAIAYQGFAVAGFAFMAAAWLLRRHNPSVVSSFNFISPVVGVFLSTIVFAEPIRWNLWAGLVAVGLGLVIVTRKGRPAPPVVPSAAPGTAPKP